MYAPDFWLSHGVSRTAGATPERSVQPPTLELYQPHVISRAVLAPDLRLVIDLSRPVSVSKASE